MVGGRAVLGFAAATAAGWVVGEARTEDVLRSIALRPVEASDGQRESRPRAFLGHLGNEFMFMGKYLMLGAAIAALVQTFLPQQWLAGVASLPLIGTLALMLFAVLLSLCSESDAFVAASLTQFGPGAQLSFLVFGPMVDLKLGALYFGTFKPTVVRSIVVATGAAALVGASWISVIYG